MNQYKIYRTDNYITVINNLTGETQYGFVKDVFIDKSNINKASYRIFGVKDFTSTISLLISQLLKEDGTPYTQSEFETFYTQNTGNFNSAGTGQGVQSITGSTVDNTDPENPIITAIEEAPIDGNQYGRQDGAWTEITAGVTPDLQAVMENGSSWIKGDSSAYFSVDDPSLSGEDNFVLSTGVNNFSVATTGFNITANDSGSGYRLIFASFVPTIGNLTFNLPHTKPAGTYIVATTDLVKYGTAVIPLDGLATVFTIAHGMGVTPASFSVTFRDAGNLNFVQSIRTIDSTNITFTCNDAPALGSQTVYWQVFK